MEFKKILVKEEPECITFSINRPNALNAIDFEVMDELEHLLQFIEKKNLKMLIFCAPETGGYVASGGDLVQFANLKSESDGLMMARKMAEILKRIESLPLLTIAFINGQAFGGGCEMSLAFDLIYTNESTLMGFTQAKFALSPGWNGSTRLVERVGKANALHILLTQKKLSGEEALQYGLAQDFFHTDEQFQHRVHQILSYDKAVIRGIKAAVKSVSTKKNRENTMEDELNEFAKMWAAEPHHKAVEAFINRKKS
ncbi:enoyl-CoA hydratase/isomerase family protein [bacterium]|nr:MAG: enoyl-CoA hydratase/isomerase family protein [bacterium]